MGGMVASMLAHRGGLLLSDGAWAGLVESAACTTAAEAAVASTAAEADAPSMARAAAEAVVSSNPLLFMVGRPLQQMGVG